MTTVDRTPAQHDPKTAELAIPDQATDEVVGIVLSAHAARVLTDGIRDQLTAAYDGVIAAYHGRAWIALGYDSFDAYCKEEFKGTGMVHLSPFQRRDIVGEMREAGMSTRAISSALGVSQSTVVNDLPTEQNYSVEPITVTSLDGRKRPAQKPPRVIPTTAEEATIPETTTTPEPARRKRGRAPLAKDFFKVIFAMGNKIALLGDDDRFDRNAEQLTRHIGELTRMVDILTRVLDRLHLTAGELAEAGATAIATDESPGMALPQESPEPRAGDARQRRGAS